MVRMECSRMARPTSCMPVTLERRDRLAHNTSHLESFAQYLVTTLQSLLHFASQTSDLRFPLRLNLSIKDLVVIEANAVLDMQMDSKIDIVRTWST
eukprot:4310947-Amphidinium_carterae.1